MADTALTAGIKPGNSIGASADSFTLPLPVRQVAVLCSHATQTLLVKPFFGSTKVAATAAAQAGLAGVTATGDGVFFVAAVRARRVVVGKMTGRPRFVSLAVLGSGAATTFDIEGTDFFD